MIFTPYKYYMGSEIKENEFDGSCVRYWWQSG